MQVLGVYVRTTGFRVFFTIWYFWCCSTLAVILYGVKRLDKIHEEQNAETNLKIKDQNEHLETIQEEDKIEPEDERSMTKEMSQDALKDGQVGFAIEEETKPRERQVTFTEEVTKTETSRSIFRSQNAEKHTSRYEAVQVD